MGQGKARPYVKEIILRKDIEDGNQKILFKKKKKETKGPKITESQKRKMEHTLGLDYRKKPFRNRYVTDFGFKNNDELIELVDMGLMGRNKFHEQGYFYWVTEEGAKFLGVELPED